MNQVELAFFLIVIAGFLQGTFGIFIKNVAPLKWENFWAIFSFISYLLAPVIFAFVQVQNLFPILFSLPFDSVILPLIFGCLWGIGSVIFGLCVIRIGVSLTYSIVLGLVTLLGAILPIFINNITFAPQALAFLIIGLSIVPIGVFISGYAGVIKEKKLNPKNKASIAGILLAVISGIFSSFLNVGFVFGKDISLHAQKMGVAEIDASALVLLVVVFGGFVTNFGYALYLMFKNNTVRVYKKLQAKIFFSILTASLFWFGSVALFGVNSIKLGSLGPSVGWAILFSLSIVISNVWGIKFGEWKGVAKALLLQFTALGLIIVGVVFIALSAL